ncbi:MAG TPA: anaerobic ribonucleoside-triphosphate reductase [Selenomonadales bacterium]|nr:anaerobic ribonucleoside-triphosphate reductase [Selenomonadales bacterium]
MFIHGVQVSADSALTQDEITLLVEEELQLWQAQHKVLGSLELVLEDDAIVVKAVERSPIRRVRRITGYLSTLDKFNDAKRAECDSREVHIS